MENVSEILNKLDPHLICEIANEVKLHEKEIGKLEKQLMIMENNLKEGNSLGGGKQIPQVNTGENSDLIQKIIK
jgi:hypothetical protein